MTNPTLRDVAKLAGVSHTTVALALRNDLQLPLWTRQRIQKLAQDAGYQPKAILSVAMAQMRRGFPARLRANLAILSLLPEHYRNEFPFCDWIKGASARAQCLGYGIEVMGPEVFHSNLGKMLKLRGVQGVVLIAGTGHPWPASFETIARDYPLAAVGDIPSDWPKFHQAMGDAFAVGYGLARHLIQDGYERIGLCLQNLPQKPRLKAGVAAGCESLNAKNPLCFFIQGTGERHAAEFLPWFRKERPTAVITTALTTRTILESAGFQIPKDVSLFH